MELTRKGIAITLAQILTAQLGLGLSSSYVGAGDGTTVDETSLIQAILDDTPAGGKVTLPSRRLDGAVAQYLVGDLNVPAGVTLCGEGVVDYKSPSLLLVAAGIRVKDGCTITLNHASKLRGLSVVKAGLTVPCTAAQANAWTGTGITIADGGHHAHVDKCWIVGFQNGIVSNPGTSSERPKLTDVNIDCRNGVVINGSPDISSLLRVHCKPFTAATPDDLYRDGTAFSFANTGDWHVLTDCFAYGFQTGISIANCKQVRTIGCAIDGNIALADIYHTVGLSIMGSSHGFVASSLKISSQDIGINLDLTNTIDTVEFVGTEIFTTKTAAIKRGTGSVVFKGQIRGGTYHLWDTAAGGGGVASFDYIGSLTSDSTGGNSTTYVHYNESLTNIKPVAWGKSRWINGTPDFYGAKNVPAIVLTDGVAIILPGTDFDYLGISMASQGSFGGIALTGAPFGKIIRLVNIGSQRIRFGGGMANVSPGSIGSFWLVPGDMAELTYSGTGFTVVRASSSNRVQLAVATDALVIDENGGCFVYAGTTTNTWTMAAKSGSAVGTRWVIKNRSSQTLVLNSSGGGKDFYTSAAVSSLTIPAGGSATIIYDETYFIVL